MEKAVSVEEIRSIVKAEEKVLLLIKTSNCTVCTAVEQQLNEFLHERIGLKAIKINIKDDQKVSGEYMVLTAPAVILFFQGKEIWRGARFISFSELEQVLLKLN
ncbi:thioredoxin family protein [Evansella sp. LMS18]|uniref:thioredoxin family protein n=1 Tax=Evansella sp. LMS18 TaxID=2924033 RepID=UPI0020D122DB|nr:thioredoxin family protein [Evansella sp. LMS18]UTR08933.1 thioredoxin family protein [Evansella sp. LMS18]